MMYECNACGTPLGPDDDHSFMIPRGPHGPLISLKYDDPAWCEGHLQRPTATVFHPGETVRVALCGDYPADLVGTGAFPHAQAVGTVVGKLDERCYAVKFADGKTVGMYANEIRKVEET